MLRASKELIDGRQLRVWSTTRAAAKKSSLEGIAAGEIC
jgi:hypothetical protein